MSHLIIIEFNLTNHSKLKISENDRDAGGYWNNR